MSWLLGGDLRACAREGVAASERLIMTLAWGNLMTPLAWCLVPAAVLAALLGTGYWRTFFRIFGIRSGRMTIEKLGFRVSSPPDVERVNGILGSFAGGFNSMISAPSRGACDRYCDALTPVYRPFAREGAAMGHTLRRLFRYDPAVFEREIVDPHPDYGYLSYVGLGFWSAMRNHSTAELTRRVRGLDPLHGHLCYDGYGFKFGFFDYLDRPESLHRLKALDGYARHVAFQGVGRSFWFVFMNDQDELLERIGRLHEHSLDAVGGLGLAAVFVNPDRLEIAMKLGEKLPKGWHDSFHLGMCFGLKARSANDPSQFERDLLRMPPSVQDAIRASIAECDRVETSIRADPVRESYRAWRERVTDWMSGNVIYPMERLVSATVSSRAGAPASV